MNDIEIPPEAQGISRRAILAWFGGLALARGVTACSTDETFLHLSVLLTGFDELVPADGRLYLRSLEADPQRKADLNRLYEQAGYNGPRPPQSLEDLETRGIFQDAAFRGLADRVTMNWYTGIYETSSGPQVATYVDALAFHADGLHPPTTRGGPPGHWSKPPILR